MLRRWSQERIPGGCKTHHQNSPPKEQDDQDDFGFSVQALCVVLTQARALFGQKKIPEVGIGVVQGFCSKSLVAIRRATNYLMPFDQAS